LVQNLGLDSEALIPLLVKIVARDHMFAELLLSTRHVWGESLDSNGWSIPGFLLKLYETQSEPYSPYYLVN
jgi:hypothetical protein